MLEAQAARVVLTGFAPAVASPVTEGLDQKLERRPVRQHRAAFTHRDVVRGVEAQRPEVAERPGQLASVRRSERVAVVLDQPEVVLLGEVDHRVEVEGVPERVRGDDRPRPRPDRRLELRHVEVVRLQLDVDEDRDEPVEQDRVERRREACGDGDHLVARAESPLAELLRRQRRDGEQVRGRARVAQAARAARRAPSRTRARSASRSGRSSARNRATRRRDAATRPHRRRGPRPAPASRPARIAGGRTRPRGTRPRARGSARARPQPHALTRDRRRA